MGKWDPYSRRELRRRRSEWLRRQAGRIAGACTVVLTTAALAAWWIVTVSQGPLGYYVLGALHAALFAVVAHLLNIAFLAFDREAIRHVRGAWGEENTRSELQRAKRRRLAWGWVDSIEFRAGDIDHVVVTRRGGIVAIDSKWRNQVGRDDVEAMAASAQKARRRAEALARQLLPKERGAHRARTHALIVTPVVVLWGAAQGDVPDDCEIDGVRFLAGRKLVPWLRTLDGDPVSGGAAKEVLDKLQTYRAGVRQAA